MEKEKKYWERVVSGLFGTQDGTDKIDNQEFANDFSWAMEVKSQLHQVFIWDTFDKKEAKLRLNHRLFNKEKPIVKLVHRIWFRAAVILIAIISGALLYHVLTPTLDNNRFTEIVVPMGQMTQVNLPDGSKIWLNSGSVFSYPTEFGHNSREVSINGEAFMDVAKNKSLPFIVNTNDFSLEVMGTSFNVSAYKEDEQTSVTLVEGSVLLQSNNKSWSEKLIPGQSAIMDKGLKPTINKVNTEFYTSWKEGKIVFRKETLEEITKKMERWYNIEIEFKNEELRKLLFSGTFLKYKPAEQVFQSLCIMNDSIDYFVKNRSSQKNIIYIIKKEN